MGRQDNIVLSNDGVITGGGRIDTGLFRNRYLGEIRVNAGQSLIFDPTAQINSPVLIDPLNPDSAAQSAGPGVAPAANWGLIDVIGTPEARAELEIERALPTPQRADSVPFWNAALEGEPDPANPIRRVGQITAAHSTLRFRPGLLNQGKLSFIAGDNLVVGQVVNLPRVPLDPSDPVMLPAGEVAVAGNGTTVTFEDHFFNHGVLDVFPNASLILFENDFTQSAAGTTAVTIGGRPTGEEVGFASVLGDLILDGGLDVELFAGSSGAFNPMAGDQYQIMAAAGQVIGQFNQLFLPALPPGLLWGSIDYLGGVTLPIVDGTMIMGADFNGDGVIDDADFAIWLANVGITMGATPAMGDADGDGDVDGDDLLIWQNTMAPGAGSGTIVGTGQGLPGNVPEPASLLLLVSGCTMALALRRRTA
jgi:hypothetical protein